MNDSTYVDGVDAKIMVAAEGTAAQPGMFVSLGIAPDKRMRSPELTYFCISIFSTSCSIDSAIVVQRPVHYTIVKW